MFIDSKKLTKKKKNDRVQSNGQDLICYTGKMSGNVEGLVAAFDRETAELILEDVKHIYIGQWKASMMPKEGWRPKPYRIYTRIKDSGKKWRELKSY